MRNYTNIVLLQYWWPKLMHLSPTSFTKYHEYLALELLYRISLFPKYPGSFHYLILFLRFLCVSLLGDIYGRCLLQLYIEFFVFIFRFSFTNKWILGCFKYLIWISCELVLSSVPTVKVKTTFIPCFIIIFHLDQGEHSVFFSKTQMFPECFNISP